MYSTEYGGFIDALREGGGVDKDVNGGNRTGGRVSLRFEPSDNLTITPRVLYQSIDIDGFNRREVYNLYANPYTTTRPAVTFDERQQFLLLREKFKDDTTLADLTLEANLKGFDLTSVSSYVNRDILVSRDASALTGSVSVDLGFPDAGVLLPSNLRDTTKLDQYTQEVRLSSSGAGAWQWLVGAFYSKVDRFYRQRLPTPATTPTPIRYSARARRRQSPTAFPRTRPTTPTCRTTSNSSRCSARPPTTLPIA